MTGRAHPFQADQALPADHRGGRVCGVCGLPEGNRVHELPDVPEQQESRRRVGDDTDSEPETMKEIQR